MASAARTAAACVHSVEAERIERRAPVLRRLVEQAIDAQDAHRQNLGKGASISDAEYSRTDEAAFDAKRALLDHLLEYHGITTALANRIGEIL